MKTTMIMLSGIFLISLGLNMYAVSYPSFKWMDEKYHVPAGISYLASGQFEPEMWEHPPLRHILLKGFLEFFGDTPYGWRMRNVLSGALAAVLTFLFAKEISDSRKTALLAGLLIATDPLHIVLSRFTFDEIYGGVFFLAAITCYLKHRQRCIWLIMSALLIGCAVAVKWYYVPGWLLLLALALHENANYRNMKTSLFIIGAYLLIPFSVYICAYYPWFGRGYTLSELAELIVNAYYSLQKLQAYSYDSGLLFLTHTSAMEWFVRPVMVGQGTFSGVGTGRGEFIMYMNDFPIWVLTFPAMAGILLVALKERNLRVAQPAFFFFATYALFFFVKRPAFIYSAATLIPFAFTAIAYCITRLSERFNARIYLAALMAMLTWNLYLYPLVTAKKVPVAPYRLIIEHADIKLVP